MASLYLIPVTLGDTAPEHVFPPYNREIILHIRHFIVEELRTARRFLKLVDRDIDIDSLTFNDMGKHSDLAVFSAYLDPLRRGEDVGLLSEAGCPAVADPGAAVVEIAQREGYKVVPLVGPSSILLSIMASGFNGQSFAFHGYLPIDSGERTRQIRKLEARAYAEDQTQIFIETPYRNAKIFADLCAACNPKTRLCVAAGLTTEKECVKTLPIAEWKKRGLPDLGKIPAVFLIYKSQTNRR